MCPSRAQPCRSSLGRQKPMWCPSQCRGSAGFRDRCAGSLGNWGNQGHTSAAMGWGQGRAGLEQRHGELWGCLVPAWGTEVSSQRGAPPGAGTAPAGQDQPLALSRGHGCCQAHRDWQHGIQSTHPQRRGDTAVPLGVPRGGRWAAGSADSAAGRAPRPARAAINQWSHSTEKLTPARTHPSRAEGRGQPRREPPPCRGSPEKALLVLRK